MRSGAQNRESDDAESVRLIERFASEAEIGGRHEVIVDAPADIVFEVAENFDLLSIPAVYAIFWLRARMLGARPPGRGDLKGLVATTRSMGWQELARQPGRELVMGAAVQPWLPDPVFKPIPPERFREYGEPEHVKIVWTLEAEPLGPTRTRFRTETRVQPTDKAGRGKFRRYWRLAGIGIVLIRLLALPAMRREAERKARAAGGSRHGAGLRATPRQLGMGGGMITTCRASRKERGLELAGDDLVQHPIYLAR